MERAGEGLARMTAAAVPEGRIAIVCGKGNNGGDGLVAARHLRRAGRDVDLLAVWGPGDFAGDAAEQLRLLPGTPPEPYAAERLAGAAGIVDALLGTGSSGEPRDPAAAVIADMSAADARVVAADVPSGVDASTGEVPGVAVRARVTATFHHAKPGLWIAPGKEHAGRVEVIDIGIPPGGPGDPAAGLIRPEVLADVPRRGAASTKFTSGVVVVIGGSHGLAGAPTMAALAAMRSGAGYVQVAAPASLGPALALKLLEAMVVTLPETDGALGPDAVEAARAAVERADAVVLGPGLGRAEVTQAFVRELVARLDVPLVIDADGLNALAGHLDRLHGRSWPTVLTPHAGELGRLLATDAREIERARLHHARAAAERARALVVLKGDDTLVAAPSGRVAVSEGGAPALATAGTGDVLAGLTGAMLAKGLAPAHAACAAVHGHVRAGRLAAQPHGPDGVIASDVIAALPRALSR
jgi:NAD(P)H-hydrate epimerase